jgi:hypothetical protein
MKTRSPDTIWYLLLPEMEKMDIHVTRDYFKTLFKKICDKFGKKRSDIGIITGARAELYFAGGWRSVSFDAIDELAQMGTDIVFIEKEGIIDELKSHADKYGVAMVNSRGYLTEYAHDLMNAADESGANVIIITDSDLSGVNLASKCSIDISWVTMDDNTLDFFGLQKDSNIVVRATNKKLISRVQQIIEEDPRFQDLDIDFLKESRIEINAIIAQVGDVRFWKFIMDKLQEIYPTRNYNRAIELPSQDLETDETDLYPNAIRKFILYIRKREANAVKESEQKIKSEQEEVTGFLEVAVQKQKNKELVMKAISEDEDIKKIELHVTELCGTLGINLDEKTEAEAGDSTRKHFRPRKKSR